MKLNQIIFDVHSKRELEELITKSLGEAFKNTQPVTHKKEELLTREEACELLKIDLSTLWRWTKKGRIDAYGIGKRVFYKKDEIFNSLIKIN